MGRLFLSLFFLPALLFAGTSVERTWNGQPFAYDSEVLETRRGYTVYRLTYPAISPPSFPVFSSKYALIFSAFFWKNFS